MKITKKHLIKLIKEQVEQQEIEENTKYFSEQLKNTLSLLNAERSVKRRNDSKVEYHPIGDLIGRAYELLYSEGIYIEEIKESLQHYMQFLQLATKLSDELQQMETRS